MSEPLSSMTGSSPARRWLPLIIGMAIGLRIALALLHPITTYDDSKDYDTLARAILHHQHYALTTSSGDSLIASRMPGYPLFMAAIYAIAGESAVAVLVVQAFIGAAIVWLTYLLGRRFGENTGLLAAGLAAIDPLSLGFSCALLSETPFTLCLLLGLWLTFRIIEATPAPHPRPLFLWAALGLTCGVAVYLRASILWLIIPWSFVLILLRPRPLRSLTGALLAILILFAALSPWLIRNYAHFHSGPFRLTTLEGISLYEAVYPGATGGPKQHEITLPPDMVPLNEAQRNDEWSRMAWQHIREEPLRIARLALVKLGRTWSPTFNAAEMRTSSARPIQYGMALWYVPLFLLAAIGLCAGAMPWKHRILVFLPILYFSAVHALFLGSVRYRVPLMPLVCILAASGIVILLKWLSGGKRSRANCV